MTEKIDLGSVLDMVKSHAEMAEAAAERDDLLKLVGALNRHCARTDERMAKVQADLDTAMEIVEFLKGVVNAIPMDELAGAIQLLDETHTVAHHVEAFGDPMISAAGFQLLQDWLEEWREAIEQVSEW